MKKLVAAFAAFAFVLASLVPARAAQPAQISGGAPSSTFSSLTTIYIASGVFDDGGGTAAGNATNVTCSNLSGKTAQLRVTFYHPNGSLAGTLLFGSMLKSNTLSVSTHNIGYLFENSIDTGFISQGMLLVQSTQSAVFCTAAILHASGTLANGVPLHMVRYNPHPGTVE